MRHERRVVEDSGSIPYEAIQALSGSVKICRG
jgi:hypothetical protein